MKTFWIKYMWGLLIYDFIYYMYVTVETVVKTDVEASSGQY